MAIDLKNKISLIDLNRYSDWYQFLEGNKIKAIKKKSKKEVLREFDNEKWKDLKQYIDKNKNQSVQDIDKIIYSQKNEIPIFYKNNFYLTTAFDVNLLQLEIYKKIILQHLENDSTLVELGAGYGSKILNFSSLNEFKNIQLIAGELSLNGQNIIKTLSKNMNKDVKSIYCDLDDLNFSDNEIPENSIIFTSYSVHYIPILKQAFINNILKLKPKIVIHFEPCYELNSNQSKYELMCQKYIELNDYNKNLLSILKSSEEKNQINLSFQKNIIGVNPFLPISCIKWSPS